MVSVFLVTSQACQPIQEKTAKTANGSASLVLPQQRVVHIEYGGDDKLFDVNVAVERIPDAELPNFYATVARSKVVDVVDRITATRNRADMQLYAGSEELLVQLLEELKLHFRAANLQILPPDSISLKQEKRWIAAVVNAARSAGSKVSQLPRVPPRVSNRFG